MNTKNIFLPEENFNFSDTKNLSLCIEVGFRHFTACVINETSFKIIYAEHFDSANLSDIKKQSKVFDQPFQNVYVSIFNPDFTLIPNAIFSPETLGDFLSLNLGGLENQIEKHQTMEKLNCVTGYRMDKEVIDFFKSSFKQVSFTHSSHVYLNLIHPLQNKNDNTIYINCYSNNFLACYYKNNQLELLNSFEFKTDLDFIYMILFLCKELGIEQEKANIIISGNSQLAKLLNEYISSVSKLESSFISESIASNHKGMFDLTSFIFKCA